MRIENTILFGKYQLGPMIGQGRSGTVWLSSHLGLEEQRAIKRVPKQLEGYEAFRREALLLKELRHPGIPIIYDLEEDTTYCYLIEEYLEGDSLYDLVREKGHLNQDTVIHYGIQICDLVQYLHSAGQTPILYLDLQPKNLLVCHEQIKLLDFDHAARVTDANEDPRRYGTPGFCAPEQMDGSQTLDVRTDVYAIGCILFYMLSGTYPDKTGIGKGSRAEGRLRRVIRGCLSPRKEDRYPSARDVGLELKSLAQTEIQRSNIHKSGMRVFKKNNISSLMIALVGSKSGVGTTHLGISLSCYLNYMGYPNLYEEHSRPGIVRQLARCCAAKADSYGIFNIRNTRLLPSYGDAVALKEHPYQIVIHDYGTDWKAVKNQTGIHMTILVLGGKWWDIEAGEQAAKALCGLPDVVALYTHTLPDIRLKAPVKADGMRCFRVPYFADPFLVGIQNVRFWDTVMKPVLTCRREGTFLQKCIRKTARVICRRIGLSVSEDLGME